MEFSINRDIFLKSLSHAYGIIEKKTTLPILSNVLIDQVDYPFELRDEAICHAVGRAFSWGT